MASITVYRHGNFQGRSETFTSEVPSFVAINFNDEVSSVRIPAGSTWMLYQHVDYQGAVSILGPGDYASPAAMGFANDALSSLRPFPTVNGPTALLFKDSKFRGRMVVCTEDTPNLVSIGYNDVLSSAIVLSGSWTLYKHINYAGTQVTLTPGRYPEPTVFNNDDISSLKPITASITLYQHNDYNGRRDIHCREVCNMQTVGFNDQVSSCKIPTGSTWMLYEHASFQGQVSILGAGEYPNAGAMQLQNDTLSSLRPFPIVAGPTILLFQDVKFRGRMLVLTGAASSLVALNFNDVVSSMIVLSGNWAAYKHVDFQGTKTELTPGRYPIPSSFQNDDISSLKPHC